MLVVLPLSRSDAHLTDAMERAFQKFSPGANHNLLVVASPDAKNEAEVLLNKLRGYFVNAALEVFVSNNTFGWPRACNHYFQQACYTVSKYVKPTQGWLWMEMDSVPLTSNWLTILEQEYYADALVGTAEGRSMRRFMGAPEKTLKSVQGELVDDGFHMASNGVYPGDFGPTCPVLKSIPGVNNHFSVHLKWYPVKSFNSTKLIQNNRDTNNYRQEEGKIVCDSIARNAWDFHYNEVLSEEAILLHGCKDGSLIDLVPESRTVTIPQRNVVPIPKVQAKPYAQHVNPYQTAPLPYSPPQVQPTPVSLTGEAMRTTPVVHAKLPPPTVRKFGEHAASKENVAPQKYDESGLAIATPAPIGVIGNTPLIPVPSQSPETPALVPVVEQKAPTPRSYKKGPKKGRRAWTPEQRQQASERAKKMVAEGKFGRKSSELATA